MFTKSKAIVLLFASCYKTLSKSVDYIFFTCISNYPILFKANILNVLLE